jgi:hypothetical protein
VALLTPRAVGGAPRFTGRGPGWRPGIGPDPDRFGHLEVERKRRKGVCLIARPFVVTLVWATPMLVGVAVAACEGEGSFWPEKRTVTCGHRRITSSWHPLVPLHSLGLRP